MQRVDEKLCLQWNDFQQNLTLAFRDLRDDKEFTDVTLCVIVLRWSAGVSPQGGPHIIQPILQKPPSKEQTHTPFDLHEGCEV